MKLLGFTFDLNRQTPSLFDDQKGKTLEEYRHELLVRMGKRQFEKLENLGLSIPVQLG